mmetsp:Transcript_7871/g.35167  ORF Transcript_7871/g.35167 Transcript_7871/m.35167 type:complete len:270 (-) Transcript_7871:476-1285(-)
MSASPRTSRSWRASFARSSRRDRRRDDVMTREATSQGRRGGIFLASRVFFLAMFAVVALRSTTVLATMESVSGDTATDHGGDVAHLRGRKLTQQTNSVPTPDLHLVADDITDVDASNLVQSWSDHTGNGLSLSSFVAAPELVDGGNISTGALFNGHKAVRFGESGITGLSLPTSALQLSTSLEGMTVVAVMSTDDSRDATAPFLFDRGSVSGEGFGFHISPAKVKIYSAENHGGKSRTNSAPPIMKTGRCTSSPLSGSSRKAASADTNS